MSRKKTTSRTKPSQDLTVLASLLLHAMASEPARIEYNTRVLGGSFKDSDVKTLDEAYLELARLGLIERTGAVVSFFGSPKSLYRITGAGAQRVGNAA